MIKKECNSLCSEVYELSNYSWNNEEFPQKWKDPVTILQSSSQKVKFISRRHLAIISVDVDGTDQLLIKYFAFVRYWKEN
jgi:hypothetical protein